jgi:protocatechuate 3,4-dioxygenase beta subunit
MTGITAIRHAGGDVSQALSSRLRANAPQSCAISANRLLEAVLRLHALVRELNVDEAEMRALIGFLTEVGHASDERRQEWVLLADVLGFSALVRDLNRPTPAGATPSTLLGPFFRPDAPLLQAGADICLDGRGERLEVTGRVKGLSGQPVAGATVEVWHANGEGLYENQEPDRQPEFNLRGKFVTDEAGRFHFRTIRPAGYELPKDGPVGQMLTALGYPMARPAHIGFRIGADGFHSLATEFFDAGDPLTGEDALFNARPELLADFKPRGKGRWSTEIDIVLAPVEGGAR